MINADLFLLLHQASLSRAFLSSFFGRVLREANFSGPNSFVVSFFVIALHTPTSPRNGLGKFVLEIYKLAIIFSLVCVCVCVRVCLCVVDVCMCVG